MQFYIHMPSFFLGFFVSFAMLAIGGKLWSKKLSSEKDTDVLL